LSNEEILNSLMVAIDVSNKASPAYARLSRDMIHILPKDADYRRTDKGTVIRAAFYKDFATRIESAYADDDNGSAILPKHELVAFLRKDISTRLDCAKYNDDTDIFSMGVDSLQAIQIRSNILKHLKVGSKSLGRNFAFDFPTIRTMADEILRLQHGGPVQRKHSVEDRMAAMIEKYATFEKHQPKARKAGGKHIVSEAHYLTRKQLLTFLGGDGSNRISWCACYRQPGISGICQQGILPGACCHPCRGCQQSSPFPSRTMCLPYNVTVRSVEACCTPIRLQRCTTRPGADTVRRDHKEPDPSIPLGMVSELQQKS